MTVTRMDTIAWSVELDGISDIVFFPTREFIDGLSTGSLAPNCFGRLSTVAEIRYAGVRDKDGAHFVGYYTPLGDNGQVSNSITENEVVRGACNPWNSAQFYAIESAIRQAIQ